MAKREFQLSKQEIVQFQRAEASTRDVRELKRLQGVRLYGIGKSLRHIQEVLNCGESGLREWVEHYQQGGVKALASAYQRSARNASKLTAEQQADLMERLQTYRPDELMTGQGSFGRWMI